MTNLATLIGTENMKRLMYSDRNTHLVIENFGKFDCVKKTMDIDYSKVIGIGSRRNCKLLSTYLTPPSDNNQQKNKQP